MTCGRGGWVTSPPFFFQFQKIKASRRFFCYSCTSFSLSLSLSLWWRRRCWCISLRGERVVDPGALHHRGHAFYCVSSGRLFVRHASSISFFCSIEEGEIKGKMNKRNRRYTNFLAGVDVLNKSRNYCVDIFLQMESLRRKNNNNKKKTISQLCCCCRPIFFGGADVSADTSLPDRDTQR